MQPVVIGDVIWEPSSEVIERSRLKRFIESVEGVTSAVQAPPAEEASEVTDETAEREPGESTGDAAGKTMAADTAPQPAADPLEVLVRAGLELLTQMASGGTRGQGVKAAPALPVAARQLVPLVGRSGLTPAHDYLYNIHSQLGSRTAGMFAMPPRPSRSAGGARPGS